MFGLGIAAICVAIAVIFSSIPVDIAFATSFGYLFYWHLIIGGGIVILIPLLIAVFGIVVSIFGDGKEKAIGLGALFFAAPIFFMLFAVGVAFFTGGTWLLWDASYVDGSPVSFADWNMQKFVLGCVLYCSGILGQLSIGIAKMSSSS